MKTITIKFVVMAAFCMFITQEANAQKATAAKKINHEIIVAPVVYEQIQRLTPHDRKKVESAIAAGNRLMPFYLDGSYYLVVDKLWEQKIRPLVSMNAEDWYAMLNDNASGVELEIARREATNLISICPQVELVQVELQPKFVVLKYRSKVVNVHKFRNEVSELADLVLDDSTDFQEIELGINNKLISFVKPKYYGTFGATSSYVDAYRLLIQELLHESRHVSLEEQGRINEKIHQYEKWIKVFQEQEALSCRTR